MLIIDYTSVGFLEKSESKKGRSDSLACSWADLVWAASTVGRRQLQHVIRPATYAYFELICRSTTVYTHLQAADYRPGLWGLADTHLRQSPAYQDLGPLEKSAVSYFLGLTTAKLFGERLLQLPWLLHVDTYSQHLKPGFLGRLPDLAGFNQHLDWTIMEVRGRSNGLDWQVIKKANKLVRPLTRITGAEPVPRVAVYSYFTSVTKTLKVYLAAPSIEDKDESGRKFNLTLETYLANYYRLFLDFLDSEYGGASSWLTHGNRTYRVKRMAETDMQLGLDEQIYTLLKSGEKILPEKLVAAGPDGPFSAETTDGRITVGSDGIYVQLGDSWRDDKMSLSPAERVQ
ncbi:MAG: hypothetical protein JXM69_14795 [Anaerolineae bacterium]|nr:hypothetical protein [Anaerolineae bacterium]